MPQLSASLRAGFLMQFFDELMVSARFRPTAFRKEDLVDYTPGRNLLWNTAEPVKLSSFSKTERKHGWAVSSGGDGTGTVETVSDSPVSGLTKSLRITGNSSGNRDFVQLMPDFGSNLDAAYVFSAYVRGIGGSASALIRSWNNTAGKAAFSKTVNVGTGWVKVTVPAKPTAATPSGWVTTEPSYTEGSTNSLYTVDKTTLSDGTFEYSDVSLSSSYEAAKAAYNKSVQAKETADAALQQSVWYAVCDTAAATVAKAATITPATTDFALQAGAAVNVKFDNTNSGAVGSITLNVNGTGAKPIKHIYTTVGPSNLPSAGYLRAGNMYQFLYDGTYWLLQSNYYANTVGIYGSGALFLSSFF